MPRPTSAFFLALPPPLQRPAGRVASLFVAAWLTLGFACAKPESDGPGEDLSGQEPATDAVAKEAKKPAAAPTPPTGIDVSHYSGEIDWRQVRAAGYRFAYVKATEGVDSKDPRFDDHWRALATAELPRGAYHFFVTEDGAEEQARWFIENVTLGPGDLRPAVDIETLGHGTQPGLADRLRRWLEIVEEHYGVQPMIYTSPRFWEEHLDSEFGDYDLWIAEYEVDDPQVPDGWDTWLVWQWRGDAPIPGVEKGADLSRLHPDHTSLEPLEVPATAP